MKFEWTTRVRRGSSTWRRKFAKRLGRRVENWSVSIGQHSRHCSSKNGSPYDRSGIACKPSPIPESLRKYETADGHYWDWSKQDRPVSEWTKEEQNEMIEY